MEMPTPCQRCREIFDQYDGTTSEKWFPNTIICSDCGIVEASEIEREEEIKELNEQISDAAITITEALERLLELGEY